LISGAPLRVTGLTLTRDGATILRDVTLEGLPGRPLALIGPSGSGKTTLLMALAGLIQPSSGEVRVGDRALARLNGAQRDALRRHELSLLSQELNLLPELSVERNAALAPLVAGLGAPAALTRAREELSLLGMEALLRRPAKALSRGQQQRVALARALAHPGTTLLLDEPTTALDAALRDRLLERLSLRANAGQTLILATHDPVVAAWAAERRALRDGALVPE